MTGAGGWLGSHLVRWLLPTQLSDGPRPAVFALVRPGSDRSRLRDVQSSITLVECDLGDRAELDARLETIRPQVCFHFAWYAVPGLYLHSQENLAAVHASVYLALRLAELECRRFVGIGTCFEYAMRSEPLEESDPTEPRSIYAASKLAFRLLLEQIAQARRMRWLWARVFYQYGPYEDPRRLVPTVVRALLAGEPALLTSGEQQRDFLHAADVASAIGTASGSPLDGIVNIGSGVPVRVADLALKIGAMTGHPELVRLGARPNDPHDPAFVCADPSRLMSTGWRPTYNLDTGLANTIEWFRR
ncbi:MAG: NAD(P)-dependent oxidoreductase [Candidatus Dormibacteraeota bacterium]|nr:NAD(P)-dependent oxidoreductase [Candidatus Dormibacteraeota bacterium]